VCVDLSDPAEECWRADAGGAKASTGSSGHSSGAKTQTEPETPPTEQTRGGTAHTHTIQHVQPD